jgi:cytochrome c oxidase cbb3-type subunit 3
MLRILSVLVSALLLASGCARPDTTSAPVTAPAAGSGEEASGTATAGSAPSAPPGPPAVAPVARAAGAPAFDPALAARGAELYAQYCSLCHGENGEGYAADNANALANQDFLAIASDGFLRTAIQQGRPGTVMSAWGVRSAGPLANEDIDALIAMLRSWQTVPSIDVSLQHFHGSALRGREPYETHCASCHGQNGEGVTAVSLSNPWFLTTASEGYLGHTITNGRAGTAMRGFADTLSRDEISNVVAYIRSWSRPVDGPGGIGFEPDYARAVINPDGPAATFTLREDRFVAVDDVKAALDAGQSFIMIDARATSDYLDSHIAGSISVPFYGIERAIASLPPRSVCDRLLRLSARR